MGTRTTITITTAQLQALRDGEDTIVIMPPNGAAVVPYSTFIQRPPDYRRQALSLLRSGHAHVLQSVRFDGRRAVEISSSGPTTIPGLRTSCYLGPRAPTGCWP